MTCPLYWLQANSYLNLDMGFAFSVYQAVQDNVHSQFLQTRPSFPYSASDIRVEARDGLVRDFPTNNMTVSTPWHPPASPTYAHLGGPSN